MTRRIHPGPVGIDYPILSYPVYAVAGTVHTGCLRYSTHRTGLQLGFSCVKCYPCTKARYVTVAIRRAKSDKRAYLSVLGVRLESRSTSAAKLPTNNNSIPVMFAAQHSPVARDLERYVDSPAHIEPTSPSGVHDIPHSVHEVRVYPRHDPCAACHPPVEVRNRDGMRENGFLPRNQRDKWIALSVSRYYPPAGAHPNA